ncbi:MAG: 50S ribosomal protein L13 [Patescibacteria group bacterium]|jgi:large subunit ribosomal protein L13
MANKTEQNRNWYIFDLKDQILGRSCTRIADILNGKNRPDYLPNLDLGGYVVVINAKDVKLSGNKELDKRYYKHTSYIGNLKTKEYKDIKEENPEFIIKHAVSGMLPKNKLQALKLNRLKVYAGDQHPHVNVKFVNK